MDNITSTEVSKGGEDIFRISFEKSLKTGCRVTVWAHQLIEEFFATRMVGEPKVTVVEYGQQWNKMPGEGPLLVYALPTTFPQSHLYNISGIGEPLLVSERDCGVRGGMPNLAILRLVGISNGLGVTFGYNAVGSTDFFDRLARKLGDGAKAFYLDHLKPVNISVSIHAQKL